MKFKIGDKVRLNPNKNYRTLACVHLEGILVIGRIKEGVWGQPKNKKYNKENTIRFTVHPHWSYPESFLMREHETEV